MIAIQTRFIRYFASYFSASDVTLNKVRSCGRSLTHPIMNFEKKKKKKKKIGALHAFAD